MPTLSSQSPTRRRFLQVAGLSAVSLPFHARAAGANETVRVALIGCGSRGGGLAGQFAGIKGVDLVALSDPDTAQMDRVAGKLGKKIKDSKIAKFQDYRKLLEHHPDHDPAPDRDHDRDRDNDHDHEHDRDPDHEHACDWK